MTRRILNIALLALALCGLYGAAHSQIRRGINSGDITGALGYTPVPSVNPVFTGHGTFTGDQGLAITPRSSPLSSRGSEWRYATSVNAGLQQMFFGSECISQNSASSLGGNVCDQAYIYGTAGSGGVWARTDVNELSSSFPYTTQSSIVHEVDTNNLAGDRNDFGVANNVGILLNGLGKRNTAAISVQTGNTTGALPIWYHGIQFGANSIYQYAITDRSNAGTTLQVEGAHNIGVDLSGATITGAGIRIGAGFAQGIYVRNSTSTYNLMSADASGQPYIGSTVLGNVFSNGNLSPSATNTYSVGATTNRWAIGYLNNVNIATGNTSGITTTPASTAYTVVYADSAGQAHLGSVALGNSYVDGNLIPITSASYALGSTTNRFTTTWTANINGVPVSAVATPASATAACAAGQMAMDASFVYTCVATNTWRRAATATW